jgi:hypothetical protein
MGTLRSGVDLARGRPMRPEFVSRHPFMRARIRASEPLTVHADGSLIGTLPVEVQSIPHAVRVVMPDPAHTVGSVTAAETGQAVDGRGEPDMDHTDVAITPESEPASYAGGKIKWQDAVRWPLLAVSAVLWLVVAALSVFVATHLFLPLDATIESDIQATNLGPLPLIFPFFSWIGDAKGAILEVAGFALLLLVNRRPWSERSPAAGTS